MLPPPVHSRKWQAAGVQGYLVERAETPAQRPSNHQAPKQGARRPEGSEASARHKHTHTHRRACVVGLDASDGDDAVVPLLFRLRHDELQLADLDGGKGGPPCQRQWWHVAKDLPGTLKLPTCLCKQSRCVSGNGGFGPFRPCPHIHPPRTLFPDSCIPVKSSRFMCSSQPGGTPGTAQGWMGVGSCARWQRCFGICIQGSNGGWDAPTELL